MLQFTTMKARVSWPLVRAHLCTLAVSVGLNATWRAPRDAFRSGALQHALLLSGAALLALPLALLQVALGQLSQQDAVGVWRAVPFFRGVGYLRLLVSFVGCVYTVVHVALTVSYFLFTLSSADPLDACPIEFIQNNDDNTFNVTDCLSATFMPPVSERAEYFVSMSLMILFIWIALPFLLYSPVKLMKRVFYILGPVIVLVGLVVGFSVGSLARLTDFYDPTLWSELGRPRAWLAAITQALLSSQVAGGFLISAGDSIYSSTNVKWTAMVVVSMSAVASWCGLVFWFAVGGGGGGGGGSGSAAVLVQMTRRTDEGLNIVWPLLVYATLFLSGIITMLAYLYPVYDRVRRAGGARWRAACAGACAAGAALSLAALAAGDSALLALEDIALPLLVCLATLLEILAFVFIYGWKALIEDVEFLTGQELSNLWVTGWCAALGVLAPLTIWWLVEVLAEGEWTQPPWPASALAATLALATLVLVAGAAVAVARQVQYDIIGKLKSSFRASRHWGPRDPITHYYWLARREEGPRAPGAGPRSRLQRRHVGQLTGGPSFLGAPPTPVSAKDINSNDVKKRSNSDDWVFTVYRRQYLKDAFSEYFNKSRSMSLDWGKIARAKKDSAELEILGSTYLTPLESSETVFKDAISHQKNSVSFSC